MSIEALAGRGCWSFRKESVLTLSAEVWLLRLELIHDAQRYQSVPFSDLRSKIPTPIVWPGKRFSVIWVVADQLNGFSQFLMVTCYYHYGTINLFVGK